MGSTFCVMTRLSSAFMEHTRWLPPGLHPSREQRRRGRPGWGVGRGPRVSEAALPQGWPPTTLMLQPDSTFCKNRVVVLMSPPHPLGLQPLLLQGRSRV